MFFKGQGNQERRVRFDDPEFEARYAVYANGDEFTHRLVTPNLCETMVDLAKTYEEKVLNAAFVDGVFLLAVPIPGNLFEPGSVSRSVYDCEEDIHTFLNQITIAHRVIDRLHDGAPPRSL